MSDIITECAKAIYASRRSRWSVYNRTWDDLSDVSRQMFLDDTRAVLTRLREPTPEMVSRAAGLCDFRMTEGVHETWDDYNKEVADIYRAMIDAALEGE